MLFKTWKSPQVQQNTRGQIHCQIIQVEKMLFAKYVLSNLNKGLYNILLNFKLINFAIIIKKKV
jgi:hypothetical protein